MKLFLDTNIFMEFIEHRQQYDDVCFIIDAIMEKRFSAYISTGCLYTLAYLFEKSLKKQSIHRPELTTRLCGYLNEVLDMANLAELSHNRARRAVRSGKFSDFEDSFQYQCALDSHCDVLITINVSDFVNAGKRLEILTPSQFVNKYLPQN